MILSIKAARVRPDGGGFYFNIPINDIDQACERIGIKKARLITTKPRKSPGQWEGQAGHTGPLVEVSLRADGWEFDYRCRIGMKAATSRIIFPKKAIDDFVASTGKGRYEMRKESAFDVDIDIDLVEKPFDVRRR